MTYAKFGLALHLIAGPLNAWAVWNGLMPLWACAIVWLLFSAGCAMNYAEDIWPSLRKAAP